MTATAYPRPNSYRAKRSQRGHAIEEGQRFLKGEYVLSRRMRRWLEPRVSRATRNDTVYLAALRLAQFILQHHAHPEKLGRDFFLCRERLPACFPVHEDGKPLYSEWHLRLAKAVLLKIGFIERVTPVAERRFFKITDKTTGETTRREGRWLPATFKHVPRSKMSRTERTAAKGKGKAKAFRAPPVLFRFATITLRLLGCPLPGERVPAVSPEYRDDLKKKVSTPYEGGDRKYSGERTNAARTDGGISPAEQAAHLAKLNAMRRNPTPLVFSHVTNPLERRPFGLYR